jgi:UDP-N-acetylglucosamine acyltransferase
MNNQPLNSIHPNAKIGKQVEIGPFSVVYGDVEIGDNTTIREYVTVNRGTKSKGKTTVGTDCLIQSYVHVAHDCKVGNHCILSGYVGLAGEVVIEDWAILGGGSLVHQFVRIGSHVMIQGGCKVMKDVPPYIMAGRDPVSYAGLNIVGLRRRNFNPEKIQEIQEIYRTVYQKGLNNSDALRSIEAAIAPNEERDHIIAFIRDSERGIIKGMLDEVD